MQARARRLETEPLEQMFQLLAVFALALVELWAAIPAGLALGLNPLLVVLGASAGAILGTVTVTLTGDRLRNWLVRRHSKNKNPRQPGLVARMWQRHGLIGLGLLAPLLTGAPIGAALGLSLGAPAGRLIVWMSLGIVFWAAILTVAGTLGFAGMKTLL